MIILQIKKCYVLTKVELHNKLSLLILLYEKLFLKKNIYIYISKMMVKSKWKSMEKQLVQSNALMKKNGREKDAAELLKQKKIKGFLQ